MEWHLAAKNYVLLADIAFYSSFTVLVTSYPTVSKHTVLSVMQYLFIIVIIIIIIVIVSNIMILTTTATVHIYLLSVLSFLCGNLLFI